MKRINTNIFVEIGLELAPLTKFEFQEKYSSILWPLWNARIKIRQLLDHQSISIRTSRAPAWKLVNAITSLIPEDFTEAMRKRNEPNDETYTHAVKRAAEELLTVLAAELNVLDTYAVGQRGAYSTSDLIENTELVLPESTRKNCKSQTLLDIQQAGRCLVFETATAAGFHIMRAIESELSRYYEHIVGERTSPKSRNWGAYLRVLEKHNADHRVVALIRHIKDSYRNPVAHPDTYLTMDEALVLMGLAVSSITLIDCCVKGSMSSRIAESHSLTVTTDE